jgi:hypothetical protein
VNGHIGAVVHELSPEHSVSHRHDDEQSMPPVQLASPEHTTLHWSVLQSTPPAHEPAPLHVTRQRNPAGQLKRAAQSPAPRQSMLHVVPAQLVHTDGHIAASTAGVASGSGAASGAVGSASGSGAASGAFGSASGAFGSASGAFGSASGAFGLAMHHPLTHTRPPSQSDWISHA